MCASYEDISHKTTMNLYNKEGYAWQHFALDRRPEQNIAGHEPL